MNYGRETDADILEEVNLNEVKLDDSCYSWETDNKVEFQSSRLVNASECAGLPFPPETIIQPFHKSQRSIARVVQKESDLVMDFAFLLCGWESRSISIQNGHCDLRYRLSLPGVTYTIVNSICQALAPTALQILTLESRCGSESNLREMGVMHQTLCRAVMENVRIHRTLVLKLGTVKSLSLFVKLTRKCCGGIDFVSRIMENITFKENGINVLLTLLAFAPYAHGDFEKKLLTFLLKSCVRPYISFINKIKHGVFIDGHVDNFSSEELVISKDIKAATGGISGILINLHNSVLQCIRNGRILLSETMRNAIRENIERARVANRMERRIIPSVKSNEVKTEVSSIIEKEMKSDVTVPSQNDQAVLTTKVKEIITEEEKEDPKGELIASLGVELEGFYKQLQGRLKSQYDLENWKKRRSQMALKRLGLQSRTNTIIEEETINEENLSNDNKIFQSVEHVTESTTDATPKVNVPDTEIEQPNEDTSIQSVHELVGISIDDSPTDPKPEKNTIVVQLDDENGEEAKAIPVVQTVKKRLDFDNQKPQQKKIEAEVNVMKKEEEDEKVISFPSGARSQSPKGQKENNLSAFDHNILGGAPKDPDADFLSLVLPLKSQLQKLNADSLIVILSGMRFFDHMAMIKKLLFFQNRFFLERVCHVVNEPIGTSWRISNVADLVNLDYQVDASLLKNVIFKAYHGICSNMTLSIGTEWPLNLVLKNETVNLIEKATTLLLEIELVKWKLGELYKDLLTSKKGMYILTFSIYYAKIVCCKNNYISEKPRQYFLDPPIKSVYQLTKCDVISFTILK